MGDELGVSQMRRFGLAVVVVSTAVATFASAPANAATQTAAAFAAACTSASTTSPNFTLQVSGDLTVSGGSGTFTGPCVVNLVTPGAHMLISGASLSGPDIFLIGGAAATSLEISGSTISAKSESFGPSGTAPGGSVRVTNSTISGTQGAVFSASVSSNDGTIQVTGSTLRSSAAHVALGASCQEAGGSMFCGTGPGARGKVTVSTTRFEANAARVLTGTQGKTTVSGSVFTGPPANVFVHAGPGGSCTSNNNTPAVACS
jgi:hypothetical protein